MTQNSSQLDRIEVAILSLTEAVQVTNASIKIANASIEITNTNVNNLVEHLYTRRDVVELDILDIKNDLHELKEITKQQNITADRYAEAALIQAESVRFQAESVKSQAESVKSQAENIRLLIEMLNRKQA